MTTEVLYQYVPHGFLHAAEVKAFKIIKTSNGSRKLVGYYETFDKMKEHLNTPQNWGSDSILTWVIPDHLKKNNGPPKNSKGKAFTKQRKDSSQNQDSKRNNKNTRVDKGHKKKHSSKKKDIRKLLTDILLSFLD